MMIFYFEFNQEKILEIDFYQNKLISFSNNNKLYIYNLNYLSLYIF